MVAIVASAPGLSARRHLVALGGIVVDEIGDPEHAARRALDEMEAGGLVVALPVAERRP